MKKDVGGAGFTLVELLVVIAIIGILAGVVMLAINPLEMMRKGRDSTRLSDLDNVRKAIDLAIADGVTFEEDGAGGYLCSAGCDSVSGTRAVDGTGWVSVNVSKYLPTLPIDPKNTAELQYQFATDGEGYELRCAFESPTYTPKYVADGGDDDDYYEIGTDPGLDLR